MVAQRQLSASVEAHQILVIEHGRIVERGAHLELLAQGGRYAEMWRLQQSSDGEGAGNENARQALTA